ncbi:MAG TPA: glycine cleavage T C-terminal barrel domain-containing protein [Abditibacteriaceae bacterium]|nr:glycine cleavage T C-terminal barrel domain-containing protein [Abditibacteriaceae bacterium]
MNLHIYNSAQENAVWREMSHFGRFRCSGSEAGAILHHLTTNDIKSLRPGTGCDAALISSKARVLDWLTVYRLDDEFLVVTSPNRRPIFAPHVQKFILFRQDAHVADATDATAMCGLFGPRAGDVLAGLGVTELLQAPLNAHRVLTVSGVPCHIARTQRLPCGGVLLWSQDGAGLRRLVQESALPLCDNETFNVLRVEAGLPVAGLELTEDINPWEARLDAMVSLSKGCYNGQEVVARLHTYQKVKQRLCGLRLQQTIAPRERVLLRAEGRAAGFITSSVHSPRFGPIALAYVRGDYQEPGRELEVALEGAMNTAMVTTLPFVTTSED